MKGGSGGDAVPEPTVSENERLTAKKTGILIGSTQAEVHRDTHPTCRRLPIADGGIEAPLARSFHRGAVEVAVAAGSFHRYVGHIALGINVDDQHHRTLDPGAHRGGRVARRVQAA